VRLSEGLRLLKLDSGDCSQHDMVPIRDEDRCRAAGSSLRLTNLHVVGTSLNGTEEQLCFLFQKDASVNGTLWMGPRGMFAGSFKLLCVPEEISEAAQEAVLARSPEVLASPAPMSWVGCFKTGRRRTPGSDDSPEADLPEADNLYKAVYKAIVRLQKSGSDTRDCSDLCLGKGFSFMSLQEEGVCGCLVDLPDTDLIIPDSSCGYICTGEETLSPERFCGGDGTQAVFQIKAKAVKAAKAGEASSAVKIIVPPAVKKILPPADVPREVLKGISYAPVPLKSRREIAGGKPWPNDDFMSPNTAALWGPEGRHDLKIMRLLGANAVRLYGNDPRMDHKGFLDEALAQGLLVVAGISDYPYLQMPGSCLTTGLNCYSQVKDAYKRNLQNGFLRPNRTYHPALRTVILMNEPDLKLLPPMTPGNFAKAILSAFDAVLDAEKEVGTVGAAPNFTATFSFGVCPQCGKYGARPGLGQMVTLKAAIKNPNSFGYAAGNDLWRAYQTRFENSINTANTVDSFKDLFLDVYNQVMQGTPVFVGEYHAPMVQNEQKDLYDIILLAQDESNLLTGVSFFEYQVRYDKGGVEMTFGMFGLGERSLGSFSVDASSQYNAWCLMPNLPPQRVEKCGKMEHNVRYVVDSAWAFNLTEPIPSAELCCSKCLETPKCLSWTWEANPVPPLLGTCSPARCWLHGGLPVRREAAPEHGTVSGLPPGGRAPGANANGRSRALLSEMLVPSHVAKAYGGPGLDYSELCSASAVVLLQLTPQQTNCYR